MYISNVGICMRFETYAYGFCVWRMMLLCRLLSGCRKFVYHIKDRRKFSHLSLLSRSPEENWGDHIHLVTSCPYLSLFCIVSEKPVLEREWKVNVIKLEIWCDMKRRIATQWKVLTKRRIPFVTKPWPWNVNTSWTLLCTWTRDTMDHPLNLLLIISL